MSDLEQSLEEEFHRTEESHYLDADSDGDLQNLQTIPDVDVTENDWEESRIEEDEEITLAETFMDDIRDICLNFLSDYATDSLLNVLQPQYNKGNKEKGFPLELNGAIMSTSPDDSI